MALSRERKQSAVAEASKLLDSSKLTVMARYPGTSVKAMQQLRAQAREQDTTVKVIKNRLFRVAMSDSATFKELKPEWLEGQLLYAFSDTDELAAAQVLANFAKTEPQLELVGGLSADGQIMDADEVKVLAALPTKDQLRAQLVGTIGAPLRGLAGTMHANLRGLAQVLAARAERLESN